MKKKSIMPYFGTHNILLCDKLIFKAKVIWKIKVKK